MSENFVWRDAGRVVVFRRDGVREAPQTLREHDFESFELLSTERATSEAPGLAEAAAAVHLVSTGQIPKVSAALLEQVGSSRLVALGGGRVIDAAKAIASLSGAAVAAIPTTLSGAELTSIHRLPAGAEDRVSEMVRPEMVVADPHAMTGLPESSLRASAMNSLAHGADSLYTPFTNPVSQMTALRGAQLLAAALDQPREERNRAALAQGSLLCAYAIDSGGFGMHHVICQTLVRLCGSPHAETNAAMLPHTLAFIASRATDNLASLAQAIATEPQEIEPRVRVLGGDPPGLGEIGADRTKLDQALESMLLRRELSFTPEPPARTDLEELIEAAW